ncbi:MAG: ABC transporter ATP-binding protein [Clostridia bacterium]|nr:ABC transporter ATP-binding protein [Clostridia bacterium]
MIEIRGLCSKALNIDSLNITNKGVYGLLGNDGAGKTSLLNVLCGNSAYDSGSISVCGHDAMSEPMEVKYKVGFAPEDFGFFGDDTIFETLDFVGTAKGVPSEKRYRQIKEALELVGLEGQRKKLCAELTLHEKKLLGIAVALLGNPEIILLDEPMKNESEEEKEEIAELIKMLGKHKTAIVSSNEPIDVEGFCTHFIILSKGRCILDSSAEDIHSAIDPEIKACDGIALSISDVYCVLTHEAEEGDK